MSNPTKRDLERELAALERQLAVHDTDQPEVTVAWREAAPEERPDGIAYDADIGTLTFDLWAAQRDVLEAVAADETDIVAFLAGYGSGKSLLGARWLLEEALANPGSRFLVLGVDFTKARDSTFRVLFEQLPGDRTALRTGAFNGPEGSPIVADYNRSEHRLTLTNGSEIVLGSADSWNRYAGAEFGAIWLDEPSHYECDLHDLVEMVGSRLRGVDGSKTQLWTLTGNGYNDAWKILGQRRDKTGDPIGLNIEVVRASTLDNPYLDPGDRDRLERQYGDTEREEQALHGGFAAAQGLVYAAFDRATHVIPDDRAHGAVGNWRAYGYDYGWNDPRIVLEIGKTAADQLVVLDCFYETEAHLEDAIAWLNENDKPTGTIYCDHDPEHIDRLNRTRYSAEAATKDLDEGIAEVRKRLEQDGNLSVATETKVIVTMGGAPGGTYLSPSHEEDSSGVVPDGLPTAGLLVAERCQPLIREFLSYKEDHVGTAAAEDHCLDALRYACMGVAGR